MDLTLNNVQWLTCHKPKQTKKHSYCKVMYTVFM